MKVVKKSGEMFDNTVLGVRFATADGPRHLPNSWIAEDQGPGKREAA